jgi:hypothetical protein
MQREAIRAAGVSLKHDRQVSAIDLNTDLARPGHNRPLTRDEPMATPNLERSLATLPLQQMTRAAAGKAAFINS